MAGLFKTGTELRDERMQELAAANLKTVGQSAKTTKGKGFAQLGAALGGLLGSKLAPDAKDAAGDVELPEEADLSTAKGNFEYAKQMRDAGFEKEAQALEDKAREIYTYESKVAKDQLAQSSAGKLEKVPEPTQGQLDGIMGYWGSRQDELGEMTQQIIESSQDDPTARWGLDSMNRRVAQNVNEMDRDLRAAGVGVPKTYIEKTMVDMLAANDAIRDKSFFGGFIGKEPIIDLDAMDKVIGATRDSLMKSFTSKKVDKEAEPIKPVPAQATTKMPETPAPSEDKGPVPYYDIDPGTPLDVPPRSTERAIPVSPKAKKELYKVAMALKALEKQGNTMAVEKARKKLMQRRKMLLDPMSKFQ